LRCSPSGWRKLLDEIVRRTGGSVAVPAAAPGRPWPTPNRLSSRSSRSFKVGSLALAWDEPHAKIVIEGRRSITEDENPAEPLSDDQTAEAPDALRVRTDRPARARAFAARAPSRRSRRTPAVPRLCDLAARPRGGTCARARTATGAGPRRDRRNCLRVELKVEGRITDASNATLYCVATLGNGDVEQSVHLRIQAHRRREPAVGTFPTAPSPPAEGSPRYEVSGSAGLESGARKRFCATVPFGPRHVASAGSTRRM